MVEQAASVLDAGTWILWVDGVGGYLVCPGDNVTLGQAYSDPPADVPLLADVSRCHARVRRDAEGYWFEADRPATLNNTPVHRALLRSGDRIALGDSCQLLFTRPEPLSASARLTSVSGHRFGSPVDAVLLMAETLILSRSSQAHIVVPELSERVVIFRQPPGLALRATGTIKTGGRSVRERTELVPGEPVTVEEVSLTLETGLDG